MASLYSPPPSLLLPLPPHCCLTSLSPSSSPFQPTRLRIRWAAAAAGMVEAQLRRERVPRRASIAGVIRGCDGGVVLAFAETTEHWTEHWTERNTSIYVLLAKLAKTSFRKRNRSS
uniref:Uncharacterized protein n=1 Tax=Oryza punctata TaxID=4537 RepID=A0A0E0L1A6_ORYPU